MTRSQGRHLSPLVRMRSGGIQDTARSESMGACARAQWSGSTSTIDTVSCVAGTHTTPTVCRARRTGGTRGYLYGKGCAKAKPESNIRVVDPRTKRRMWGISQSWCTAPVFHYMSQHFCNIYPAEEEQDTDNQDYDPLLLASGKRLRMPS